MALRSNRRDQDGDPHEADLRAVRGGLPVGWMTWLGLLIAGAGWALLLVSLSISEVLVKGGSLVALMSLRSDVVAVSQTAIFTGLALALIGTLRTGFGALNGFFDMVLHRSSSPRPTTAPAPVVEPIEPTVTMPPSAAPAPPQRYVASGRIKDRNYVILPDGSVEVETLLGTRVFATLDEARDFIHR